MVEKTAGEMLGEMGTDAGKWTEQFLHASGLDNAGPDFCHTVLTWFASALEAGRSAGWATHDEATLNEIGNEANKTAHEKGWWDSDRIFPEVIALIHSEASEALEEWRNNRAPIERYYTVAKFRPEPGGLVHEDEDLNDSLRGLATRFDLRGDDAVVEEDELSEDMAWTLVLQGFLKPEGIPSELADIIIRVTEASTEYGIDLDEEVTLKMAYNATRPHKHGGKRS